MVPALPLTTSAEDVAEAKRLAFIVDDDPHALLELVGALRATQKVLGRLSWAVDEPLLSEVKAAWNAGNVLAKFST